MSREVLIEGARKRFGDTVALDGVDLRVEAGSTCVLLGPSGCGKTTLLRAVAGLERLDEGGIRIGGEPVAGPGVFVEPERRRVGMVFQDLALWPHMTARRQLAFALSSGAGDPRVARALEDCRVGELGNRRPGELSGGEQQRVALARAIVGDPDVLLLDEPLASLDVATAADLHSLLIGIGRKRSLTSIYVTHAREEAFELGDVVGVLRDGRLVQLGSPEELVERPRDAFVARFVAGAALVPGRVEEGGRRFVSAFGSFDLPEERAAGGATVLVARETDLEIAAAGPAECTARRSVYRGADWTVEADLDDGTSVRVRSARRVDPETRLRLGFRGRPWFVSGSEQSS